MEKFIGRFFNIDPLAEDYTYNSPYAFAENKIGLGRELEGCELGPMWTPLLQSNTPSPYTSTALNTARATVEVTTKAAEVTTKTNEHHIMPRALRNNEVVKAAREEGFKYDGKENKMPVTEFSKSTGKGQHGNHPKYTEAIKGKLDKGVPEGMTPVEFIRAIVKESKELIESNPDVKINEVYNVRTVIESTGTQKPELPRRIQPKTKEEQVYFQEIVKS